MFETQSSRKRLLLATTGLGTVMTTMSFLGVMSPASAATISINGANTFARQLTSTGNATLSGTTIQLQTAGSTTTANFMTFSLPSGMTFAANPSVGSSAGSTLGLSLSTGGSGAASIVYQITTATSVTATVSLTGVQIAGLQTYVASNSTATAFNITATMPNDTVTAAGGSVGGTTPVANLTDAASAVMTLGAAQTVDVSSGGNRYVSGTGTALFIPLGTVTYTNAGTAPNDVSGGSPVSMTSQGGTLTVSGSLTGISTVYAAAGVSTCATAAPTGAFTATPGATAATLTGLSVAAFQVCAIANGSSVLSNGSISVRGGVTTSNNATITGTTTSNAVSYSGTVRTSAYFVGTTGGYSSFAYAVNSGSSASTALISVRRSDGATAIGSLSSLAAGASALYGASDVNTAVGSTFLGDASSRAQVTFLFGSSSVKMTGLLLNPNGVVTQMGINFSD